MELDSDAFEFGKKQIAVAIAIFLSTLLWASLFGLTGISVNDLFTFKLQFVAEKVLSANFLFFLIAFPLPTAILAALAKRSSKTNLAIFATAASALGLMAAMFLFPQIQGLWLPAIFYVMAVPLAIETASMKYLELKKWVGMRTMLSTQSKTLNLVAVGLLVLSTSTIFMQQEQYVQKFEEFIQDFSTELTIGKTPLNASEKMVDAIIQNQVTAVSSLMGTPAYQKLEMKDDLDSKTFVAQAEAFREQLASPEYRAAVEEQARESTEEIVQQIDVVKIMKEKFPLFLVMEQFLWLFHAISLVGVFLLAGIVCKIFVIPFGLIAEQILGFFEEETIEGQE